MKILSYVCGFVIVFALSSVAQSLSSENEFWKQASERYPARQMIDLLANPTQPAWPAIRTMYWIGKQPEASRLKYQNGKTLTLSLIKMLKDDFNPDIPVTWEDLDNEISRYISSAKRIQSAGGYSNKVLSNCFYEIVLFKLSGWLVKNPTEFDVVDARIKVLLIPKIDLSTFIAEIKEEDPVLDSIKGDVSGGELDGSLLSQLKAAGIGVDKVMEIVFKLEDSKTLALIERPSAVQLSARIAGTEANCRALLGMCEFLRRGGRLDDRNLDNYGAFRALMGKDTRAYAATWLGKSFLEMGVLQRLRDLHVNGGGGPTQARSIFLDRLFN